MAELALASLAAIALLYIPGFLFFRALRLSRITALVAAPVASCAAYGVLPIAYYELGIECNLVSVALMPALVFLLAFLASRRLAARPESRMACILRPPVPEGAWTKPGSANDTPFDWAVLALYLVCGIVVCGIVFIASLGAPDAFFSRYDNQTHLNMAQSFLDSGKWSSLHPGRYLDSPANQTPYATPSSFYPATWHALVALTCLATGAKVTLASNALTAVLAAIVFPAGMFLLIRTLFPENRAAIVAGALMSVSFATYPWVFPIKGPTLPNMLGYALMVPAMAVFIAYLEAGLVRRKAASFALFALTTLASLAIAHTNALFTAFVFLAAYGGHYLNRLVGTSNRIPPNRKTPVRVGVMAAYLAALIAFWAACLHAPMLAGVIGYRHIEGYGFIHGLGSLVTLRLTINGTQWGLMIICFAGVLVCLRRRMWWLLAPVAYMALAYWLARTSVQPWLTIIVGLWYSLPYRVGACLSIFLMPVASLGLAALVKGITSLLRGAGNRLGALAAHPEWAGVALVALFIATAWPTHNLDIAGHSIETPFSSVSERLRTIYAQDADRVYGAEEVAFVEQVKQVVPEGALVLNHPNDGSVFAYGVNHLNTYFRGTGSKNQAHEAKVIRKRLNQYAQDESVREAVASTGAEYLLKLDSGVSYEDLIKLPQYSEGSAKAWSGIDTVNDSTPGFTVVLAEGDMRLYRIG